uniref:Uncharacterized protein n=1 Tax=Cannabis sativa TaxID=3483 RepID=A0A803P0R3_CANSA
MLVRLSTQPLHLQLDGLMRHLSFVMMIHTLHSRRCRGSVILGGVIYCVVAKERGRKEVLLPYLRCHVLENRFLLQSKVNHLLKYFDPSSTPPKFNTIEDEHSRIVSPEFLEHDIQDSLLVFWLLSSMFEKILTCMIKHLVDSLPSIGHVQSPKDHIEEIFNGLSREYSVVITLLSTRKDAYTIAEVESLLMAQEGHIITQCFYRFDKSFTSLGSFQSFPRIANIVDIRAMVATPASIANSLGYLDSGTTNHLINDANNLMTSQEVQAPDQIYMGNNSGNLDYGIHLSKCSDTAIKLFCDSDIGLQILMAGAQVMAIVWLNLVAWKSN